MSGAAVRTARSGRRLAAPLLFTLRTKGAGGLAARVATVSSRFGPTPRTMVRRLERMLSCADTAGFRPSCPVTGTVLARHPETIRLLSGRGMEFPIHGLRHNDHVAQDGRTQSREVADAVQLFERCGIRVAGFRAPYLRADDQTSAAVRAAGLTYQSDDAVAFPVAHPQADTDADAYRLALQMYSAVDAATVAVRPRTVDGLVRIPVCLPDDEMLVDRLHVPSGGCGDVWSQILETSHERGDLFTMQVHPERFEHAEDGVKRVLAQAAQLSGGVWCARMDEIAEWWLARGQCRIVVGAPDAEQVTLSLDGDARARLRLVGGRPRNDEQSRPHRRLIVAADPFPAVHVDPDVPPAVLRFLEEDGFLVSHGSHRCAVHLHADAYGEDEQQLRGRILSGEHPIAAIDRWPAARRSALALTGDIDALTVQDFVHRMRENAYGVSQSLLDGPRS